ncbi:unnamed protein product [Candida verbasci]|uniref:BHLH domain-containing protein n=1 Tax=Candida verbasci TaxID=1227364 RepID=A0A9W4TUT3_9ASCO|nr:unnamed protein product [Candida verbasci]
MSQFEGFKDSYNDNSIPNININQQQENNLDNLLSGSLDIKKQLSQSFSSHQPQHSTHGIYKPHSRRNSTYVKSHENSDNEEETEENKAEDDEKDTGNERKRRDNINEKIQELLILIPSEFFDKEPKKSVKKEKSPDDEEKITGTKDGKPNKGQILTKSVEYLQYLQNIIDENNRKEVELIIKLKNLELKVKQNNGEQVQNIPIRVGYTSAEKALGKIGVGPCSENYFRNVLVNSANASKSGRRGSTL